MDFKGLLGKVLNSIISVKFMVICLATWLFYIDKLNQDGWVLMVLSTTGLRLVNEVAAVYKDIRVGESKSKK